MIFPSQVADLRVGDIVEMTDTRWGDGVAVRGPLKKSVFGSLVIGDINVGADGGIPLVVRKSNGEVSMHAAYRTLTVVERAPRPFYVNLDRDPKPGDIFRSADPADDDNNVTFSPSGGWGNASGDTFWENLDGNTISLADLPPLRRLLIDGTTGKVVA